VTFNIGKFQRVLSKYNEQRKEEEQIPSEAVLGAAVVYARHCQGKGE
jgi:hypothetical protein